MRDQQQWAKDARAAASLIAALPYGQKEKGLAKAAGAQNPHSLRRAIAAINFIDQLSREKVGSVSAFERQSLTAIEHFARLYRRDRSAALEIIEDFLAGRYKVMQIRNLEQSSRDKNVFERRGRALELGFKKDLLPWLRSHVHGEILKSFSDPEKETWRRLPDFAFYDQFKEPEAAALIAGPYSDPQIYEKRLFEWIAKAEYLRRHFPVVFLVLPHNVDPAKFEAWRTAHSSQSIWRAPEKTTSLKLLSAPNMWLSERFRK